jgi:hypothetical protein
MTTQTAVQRVSDKPAKECAYEDAYKELGVLFGVGGTSHGKRRKWGKKIGGE